MYQNNHSEPEVTDYQAAISLFVITIIHTESNYNTQKSKSYTMFTYHKTLDSLWSNGSLFIKNTWVETFQNIIHNMVDKNYLKQLMECFKSSRLTSNIISLCSLTMGPLRIPFSKWVWPAVFYTRKAQSESVCHQGEITLCSIWGYSITSNHCIVEE